MKTIELRIAAAAWDDLRAYHLEPNKRVETLSFFWARVEASRDVIRILVPHTAPALRFAPDCFARQGPGHVRLHEDVQRGLLVAFAASPCNGLINIHDHWFDDQPCFSDIDDADDCSMDHYLRDRYEPMLHRLEGAVPRPIWNIAIVLGQKGAAARIIDTRHDDGPFFPIRSIQIIGGRHQAVALIRARASGAVSAPRLNRQKDFIAPEAQAALAGLHALLVGCGGTGSILAEALGRIGVGAMTLIDADRLDATSLNRWQGGAPGMIGQPKARLLARRLRAMFPHMRIRALPRSVFDPAAEAHLGQIDVIFGAVDDDAPRRFLNRVALQHLLPYFDVGVAVTHDEAGAIDFRTRHVTILPACSACLECSAFTLLDPSQTEAAFLDAATAIEWRKAGYVTDRPEVATPSVYGLNQRAVGLTVTEFLNWMCGWRPVATVVTESWAHATTQRADRANFPEGPDPDCALCSYYAGAGSSEPLPRPPAFAPTSYPHRLSVPETPKETIHG